MKRLSILFLAIMAVTMISAQKRNARHSSKPRTAVSQTQNGPQGKCGPNLRWKFTKSTGTLETSGTGAMNGYGVDGAPWTSLFFSDIKELVLNNGITSIGDYAFCGIGGFMSINIPSSVKEMGLWSFGSCDGLTSITIGKDVKEYISFS